MSRQKRPALLMDHLKERLDRMGMKGRFLVVEELALRCVTCGMQFRKMRRFVGSRTQLVKWYEDSRNG